MCTFSTNQVNIASCETESVPPSKSNRMFCLISNWKAMDTLHQPLLQCRFVHLTSRGRVLRLNSLKINGRHDGAVMAKVTSVKNPALLEPPGAPEADMPILEVQEKRKTNADELSKVSHRMPTSAPLAWRRIFTACHRPSSWPSGWSHSSLVKMSKLIFVLASSTWTLERRLQTTLTAAVTAADEAEELVIRQSARAVIV